MKRLRYLIVPGVLIGWWLVSALVHPCSTHWGAFFSVLILGVEVIAWSRGAHE